MSLSGRWSRWSRVSGRTRMTRSCETVSFLRSNAIKHILCFFLVVFLLEHFLPHIFWPQWLQVSGCTLTTFLPLICEDNVPGSLRNSKDPLKADENRPAVSDVSVSSRTHTLSKVVPLILANGKEAAGSTSLCCHML